MLYYFQFSFLFKYNYYQTRYIELFTHRYGSHVCQTILVLGSDIIEREVSRINWIIWWDLYIFIFFFIFFFQFFILTYIYSYKKIKGESVVMTSEEGQAPPPTMKN